MARSGTGVARLPPTIDTGWPECLPQLQRASIPAQQTAAIHWWRLCHVCDPVTATAEPILRLVAKWRMTACGRRHTRRVFTLALLNDHKRIERVRTNEPLVVRRYRRFWPRILRSARPNVGLRGSDGCVLVLRQRGLTELGKETVHTLKGDGLRGCDLDADCLTAVAVVDYEQAVW